VRKILRRDFGEAPPFRTATLSHGRFSARYKFTSTTATQRYRFRAVVRKDPNFPYASGTSAVVQVLVRR
jgi:hypothetical protein